jgi:hypothetical protein
MKQQQQQHQQQQEGTSAAAVATNNNYNKYTAAGGAGDGRQQDRSEKKRRANSSPAPDNYCWTYEYNVTHDGSKCWTMENGPEYTAAMKMAKHPYSVSGKTGNVEMMKAKKRLQA